MVVRNIPMYQARIPIGGGGGYGGNIDLTNQYAPIAEAIEYIIEMKRQQKQDELSRRKTEADIAYRQKATDVLGQPKQTGGKVVVGGGTTWLVDPQTGEKTDLGIPAPKGKASADLLNAWLKLGQFEEPTPTEEAMRGALGQELLSERGLEEVEVPGEKRSRFGMDWLARDIPARKEIRPISPTEKRIEPKALPVKDWQLQGMLTPEMRRTPITEALTETRKKVESKEVKEPATIEEFEAEVARLKKIDMKVAKVYYNKWVGKWQ